MKLIFAVLDVSLTMVLTRCYKTEGFFTFIPADANAKSADVDRRLNVYIHASLKCIS